MKKILIVMLAAVGLCCASQKTETTKIVKIDTVVSFKIDTVRTVVYDTLVITKTVKDTSIIMKSDTIKVSGKKSIKK